MGSRPWEVDRPLTLETARAVIAVSFPDVAAGGLEHIGSGWEFDAFLTADGWVFRFPRRAEIAGLFAAERRVLDLVSRHLPHGVAVPSVEVVGGPAPGFPYRIARHRFIEGVAADAIAPGLLPTLSRDIGTALASIHSIPEDAARTAGVGEADADDEDSRAWFESGLKGASALRGVSAALDGALDWATKLSWPFPRYRGPLRFIHQDLGPEHLIVDPTTGRLGGILDWTDAILGDPARDFVFLVGWRGWRFAEDVLKSYRGPLDEGFLERLRFLSRLLSVMWLGLAHERGSGVAEQIEWVHNAFAAASA